MTLGPSGLESFLEADQMQEAVGDALGPCRRGQSSVAPFQPSTYPRQFGQSQPGLCGAGSCSLHKWTQPGREEEEEKKNQKTN